MTIRKTTARSDSKAHNVTPLLSLRAIVFALRTFATFRLRL
jgi:hypothetical protein